MLQPLCKILAHSQIFHRDSLTDNSDFFVSDGEERRQNTSSHVHFSQSCWCPALDGTLHTYMRAGCSRVGLQSCHAWDVLHACALSQKSFHLTACFTERSSTCLTSSHHSVPRHADDTELTRTPCATPPAGCGLAIWLISSERL